MESDNAQTLHCAAENGLTETCLALIKNKADVNAQNEFGEVPLFWAASNGHTETCLALIENKADVNARDQEGSTPLIRATGMGHTETYLALIAKRADVNAAIESAAGRSSDDRTRKLLQPIKGVEEIRNIFFGDEDNLTKQLFTEQLFQLIRKKAPYADIKAVIERGANVNARDNDGYTPLHFAALYGLTEACRDLIENKADLNARDYDDHTPLHFAALHGCTEAILVLIKNKADLNAQNKTLNTPLMMAAHHGHIEAILVLIANGADVNAKDKHGTTLLQCTAMYGFTDICKVVLRYTLLSKLLALDPVQSLSERRMRIRAAIMTLKKIEEPELPREIIERIYKSKPLSNDWIACCYARYCCYFEECSITRELLCDCLGQENIDDIKQTMQCVLCDPAKHPALKSLLNPENFDSNFEELFLTARK